MGRSRRAGSVALPTDIVVGPWAGSDRGRGRGSVCWVGSGKRQRIGLLVSLGHVVDRSVKASLDHAMERKRQRIGLLGRIGEEAEDRSVGSCRGKEMAENRCFIFV